MAWFRTAPPAGRLFLSRADGRSLRRELPSGLLEAFAARAAARASPAARIAWERLGQLSGAAALSCWPAELPQPERALLARDPAGGCWLELAFPAEISLAEVAEDFHHHLAGRPAPEPLQAEAAPESRPPEIPTATVLAQPLPAPASALALRSAGEADLPLGAGPFFAADALLDTSTHVRAVDLPGLGAGDCLHSPRRGACRVLRAEGAWVTVRDARGREIRIGTEELITEFSFDDNALAS